MERVREQLALNPEATWDAVLRRISEGAGQ
jgi:hypothetical protein